MRRINYLIISSFLFCVFLFGCSTTNLEPSSYCDIWVAVLPFANSTNDLEIPQVLRELFIRHLIERGYNVVPADTVDLILLRMGISDGGQLRTATNEELADSLDADILGYGNVVQADYITLGMYLEREVEVELSLFACCDTISLWNSNGRAYTREIYIVEQDKDNEDGGEDDKGSLWDRIKGFFGSLVKLIGIQLAEKVIMDIVTHPLYLEASFAIDEATSDLPFCRSLYH